MYPNPKSCYARLLRFVSRCACLLLITTVGQVQAQTAGDRATPQAAPGKAVERTEIPRPGRSLLTELSRSLAALADRVSPAVVQVLVTGYGPVEEGGQADTALIQRQHSLGSGVIVDPEGYIVTNAHVVEGAERVQVVLTTRTDVAQGTMQTAKRTILAASIVGVHKEADLAVLKIEATGLPSLRLAEPPIRVGEIVLAIGSPEGLQNTVTMGIVSSVARQPDPDQSMVFIQTDAPINPGNSGGPLVDAEGNLVGLNTFILTQGGGSEGLGFAVPVRIVRFVYQQLRKRGHVHRSVIGISAQTITPPLAQGLGLSQDWGIIVSDVTPDGPADIAGVKVGDIVVALDGKPVDSLPLLMGGLYLHPTEEPLQLNVLRASQGLSFDIPVLEEQDSYDRLSDTADIATGRIPKLGLIGLDVTDKLAQMLPNLRIQSGVVVVAKTPRSTVADTGLSIGDVIHFINGDAVANLEQLSAAIRRFKTGDAVAVQVERKGKLMYVAFEMD